MTADKPLNFRHSFLVARNMAARGDRSQGHHRDAKLLRPAPAFSAPSVCSLVYYLQGVSSSLQPTIGPLSQVVFCIGAKRVGKRE